MTGVQTCALPIYLDEAISLYRKVLDLRPAGHPDRPSSLSSLAIALNSRFGQSGQREELDEAISLHRASFPQVADPQIIQDAIRKYSDQFCPSGYDWVKRDWGYQCPGGGHKLTWEQLDVFMKTEEEDGKVKKEETVQKMMRSAPPIADPQIIQDAIRKYPDQLCPSGHDWVKKDWGYQCPGGGHKLTWEQLDIFVKTEEEDGKVKEETVQKMMRSAPPIADPQIIQDAIRKYPDQACPSGYDWVKKDWGYQCQGGGHKLTWEQLGVFMKAEEEEEGRTRKRKARETSEITKTAPPVADPRIIEKGVRNHPDQACTSGFGWEKNDQGYRCMGGGHTLTWEQLGMV